MIKQADDAPAPAMEFESTPHNRVELYVNVILFRNCKKGKYSFLQISFKFLIFYVFRYIIISPTNYVGNIIASNRTRTCEKPNYELGALTTQPWMHGTYK